MGAWRETPEGLWREDELGVVIAVQGTIWFGYPESGYARLGPFASLIEAQRALERQERRGEGDALGVNDLDDDDDRPTGRLERPNGAGGSFGGSSR
jgi:hypothetical protein